MRNWIDLFEARIPEIVYVGTVDADRRSVEPLTQVMPSREAAERVFSNTWGTPHGAMLAFSFHPRLLVHIEYDGSGLTSDGIAELLQDRYPAVTGRNLLPFLERKGIDALRFDTPNGEDFIIINPAILSYEKTLPLEHHEMALSEAPIADISFIGDHKPASLRSDDIGIVTSPKAQMKMKRVLEKAPLPINLVFLNHTKGYEDEENIGNPMRKLKSGDHASGAMSVERFKEVYGYDLPADPTAVTAVFAFNEGTERRPFTPWMVAHRLAHLVEEADYSSGRGPVATVMMDLQRRWSEVGYENVGATSVQSFATNLGTTKAARDGEIVNFGEFIAECFAQFIVTGRIRLNKLTSKVNVQVMRDEDRLEPKWAAMIRANPEWEIPNPDVANDMLAKWASDTEKAFGNALEALKGKIVVM